MARTKSSRGVAPFKMRSGNSPLPLFGGFGQAIKKGFNTLIGKNPGGSGGGDLKTQIQEIHDKIVAGNGDTESLDEKQSKGVGTLQSIMDETGSKDPAVLVEALKKKREEEALQEGGDINV